ncbi:MAG: hypothetical protein GX790_02465 [Syntrophomonadaceae bacterium]|nr:hypothetical protein [Syntrophomonadaceae bacterium]
MSASEYIEVPVMAEFSHTSTRYENGKPTTTSYYYNYYLGSPADGYFLWQENRKTGNISYASDSPFRRYLLGITPADGASYAHATTTIRNGRGEYERFSYQNGVLTYHCFGNGENKAYQYFKPECIRSVTDTAITFKDVTGDGKPDVIFNWEGYYEPPYFSATPTRFMALTSFPESEVEGASFAYLAM